MSNRLLPRAEVAEWERTGNASWIDARARCLLMPSALHCWHEQLRLWDDPFPPAVVCCWCGQESVDMGAVPHRHGPHTGSNA